MPLRCQKCPVVSILRSFSIRSITPCAESSVEIQSPCPALAPKHAVISVSTMPAADKRAGRSEGALWKVGDASLAHATVRYLGG